jgi:hypothetical protein
MALEIKREGRLAIGLVLVMGYLYTMAWGSGPALVDADLMLLWANDGTLVAAMVVE